MLLASGSEQQQQQLAAAAPAATFFERVTRDIEIVRVALLLTGCVQGGRVCICRA
jgi:hypothetical protein